MQHIEQLIEQAQAVMTCPTCGRHYEAKEIVVKGYMEHTYILRTSCSNDHPTVFTTWITSSIPTVSEELTPLDTDHVLQLHQALQGFDGDFRSLWSNER